MVRRGVIARTRHQEVCAPMQDEPYPPGRVCPTCGGRKTYAANRCRDCANKAGVYAVHRGAAQPREEYDPSSHAGHQRAIRRYRELGVCQHDGCSADAVDRHHVDGDGNNNDPSNIRFLCRRHHMEEDGRLAELAEFAKSQQRHNYDEIADLWRRGWSARQLGERIGLPHRSVHAVVSMLRKQGYDLPYRRRR
jgi:hypothetical protein